MCFNIPVKNYGACLLKRLHSRSFWVHELCGLLFSVHISGNNSCLNGAEIHNMNTQLHKLCSQRQMVQASYS